MMLRSVFVGSSFALMLLLPPPGNQAQARTKAHCQDFCKSTSTFKPQSCQATCKSKLSSGLWSLKYAKCQTKNGWGDPRCDEVFFATTASKPSALKGQDRACKRLCSATAKWRLNRCAATCKEEVSSGVLTAKGLACWARNKALHKKLACIGPKKMEQWHLKPTVDKAAQAMRHLADVMISYANNCKTPPPIPCETRQLACKGSKRAYRLTGYHNDRRWIQLKFRPKTQAYHYCYDTEGKGADTRVRLKGFGDLDCDGVYSKFEIELRGKQTGGKCSLIAGPLHVRKASE